MPSRSNRGIARAGLAAVVTLALLAMSPALPAASGDVNQRLDRLESQVREILRMLKAQQAAQGNQHGQQPPARGHEPSTPVPAAAPAPATADARRGGTIYYYIARMELKAPPPADQARSKGVISDVHKLSFNPSDYDISGSGFFSGFRDPSEYRSVAVLLDGEYRVTRGGRYRFVVYPKPARGTRDMTQASTAMSGTLQIGGRTVVHFDRTTSWSERAVDVQLAPGMHRYRLWVVDYSAGYGPSPIDSTVELAVKRPGDASTQPLTLYVSQ